MAATVSEKSCMGWFKPCVGTGIRIWLQLKSGLRS